MQKTMAPRAGFHLFELLVALSFVGILLAFSLPIYSQHIANTRRLEAASFLSKLAIAMEEYHIEHHSYQGATLETLHFPSSPSQHYRYIIQTATQHDYVVLIEPIGWQAEHDLVCGSLTLNSTGQKGLTGTGTVADCW